MLGTGGPPKPIVRGPIPHPCVRCSIKEVGYRFNKVSNKSENKKLAAAGGNLTTSVCFALVAYEVGA